jgi:hypothetical protein
MSYLFHSACRMAYTLRVSGLELYLASCDTGTGSISIAIFSSTQTSIMNPFGTVAEVVFPAKRRARAAAFASEPEGAELQIQIEPLFDWEPIANPNSQPMSRATEMNFEQANFVKILSQKCFKRICAERFLSGESLKSKRMVQRANRQRGVR